MTDAPSDEQALAVKLSRWIAAGIITSAQADQIRAAEVLGTDPPVPQRVARAPRPSGVELLSYLGVAIALVGTFTLIYASGASLGAIGTVTLVLGIVFAQTLTVAGARAASACLGLGAVAIGVGMAEIAYSLSIFVTKTVSQNCFGADTSGSNCFSESSTDSTGVLLLGAVIALLIAFGLLRKVRGNFAALVGTGAAYTAAAMVISMLHLKNGDSSVAIAAILVTTSALLIGFAETLRNSRPDVQTAIEFFALVGATVPLYLLSIGSTHIDVAAAAISILGLWVGLALPRLGVVRWFSAPPDSKSFLQPAVRELISLKLGVGIWSPNLPNRVQTKKFNSALRTLRMA